MVRQSNVPREVWVLRLVVSKGLEFVFSLPVAILFAIGYFTKPSWDAALLPLAMLMCFLLVLGCGLILAPLAVLVRDVERIVPIVLRVLFYGSPVLYSVKDVPNHLHLFLSVNPCTGMLVLTRAAFFPQELSGYVPASRIGKDGRRHAITHTVIEHGVAVKKPVIHFVSNWPFVWHSMIGVGIIFVIGVFVFARLERPVLKEI